MVFWSTVSKSNENKEELDRKIQCKKLMFRQGIHTAVANADTGSLKCYL